MLTFLIHVDGSDQGDARDGFCRRLADHGLGDEQSDPRGASSCNGGQVSGSLSQ